MMKRIETGGITYLQSFQGCPDWYWGTDYYSGDLAEAGYAFGEGRSFTPNRLLFVRSSDGAVYEPLTAEAYQYFGEPSYVDGVIRFPFADFKKGIVVIYSWDSNELKVRNILELPLEPTMYGYYLRIEGSPCMITLRTRDRFKVLWPEKKEYEISETENFFVRDGERLYFSVECESETESWEEINVREYATGRLVERIKGSLDQRPDGQIWIIQ